MKEFTLTVQEDELEGDSSKITAAIQLVKEKRFEWDQLMEKRDQIT